MTTTDTILLVGFIIVAAGFGYRNLLASVFGRIVLALGREIKTGDRITVAGTEGIVESIGLRCTVMRTLDNVLMYVPNSIWLTSPVTHWSAGDRSRRVRMPITLPADTDLGRTTGALRRAAEQTSGIAAKPTPRALIVGVDTTGVQLELWAWISESRSVGRTIDELGRNVQQALQGRGSSRRDSDSPRSRGPRRGNDRSDRPRRSSRHSDDRPRERTESRRREPAEQTETAASNSSTTESAAPETVEASSNGPDPETSSQADTNNSGSDDEQEVSYGRSKRRVPRR